MKLNLKEQEIVDTWDRLDDGDISTERLIQMVADTCKTDVGRVTDALYKDFLNTNKSSAG